MLVTGAARRLGRAIALDLAQHGWDVGVHFRSASPDVDETLERIRALGARAEALQADLADEAACRALLPRVVEAFGRIDAVVNNASRFELDDVHSFTHASMAAHWQANTAPAILLAGALHAHLSAREAGARGVVVNLLDQKLWNMNPDFLSYTLSKAALQAAGTALAMALAPRVRVVGVAPGLTLTSHLLSDEDFAALHRQAPLGRSSTPQDVAAAVRFALDNGSITGHTLLVDGGQHLMRFERDFSLMPQK